GLEPRQGVVLHGMQFARGTVAIDTGGGSTGGAQAVPAGSTVTININDRQYQYTSVDGDTTESIRDNLRDLINAGDGDPDVSADTARVGFLSARARVTLEGKIKEGDIAYIRIITNATREYKYTVKASDNLTTIANRLIAAINAGRGDPDVTARLSSDVGV